MANITRYSASDKYFGIHLHELLYFLALQHRPVMNLHKKENNIGVRKISL